MPLIESSYEQPAVLATSISVRGELSLTLLNFVRPASTIRVRGSLENTATLNASAQTAISVSGSLNLQVNDEASVFAQLATNISIAGNLTLRRTRRINLTTRIVVDAALDGEAVAPEKAECLFRVQIVPATVNNSYQKYKVRLLANDVNVPILLFRLDYPENAVGQTLQVQLAQAVQNQFVSGTIFKFEIDDGDGWETLLDTARQQSESFVTRPTADTLSIDISSALSDKLNLAPRRTQIVFNPAKTGAVTVDDIEPDRDSDGNSYPISAVSVGNLSLYKVLQRAYVQGCGFDDVNTNLPDYPLARVDFGFDNSYHNAAGGFVGMFSPVYFENNNILNILDTSNALPAGLSPRDLIASRFVQLSADRAKSVLTDGYLVNYQSGGGDYFTNRTEYKTDETGTFGNPNFTRTETETVFREYRAFSNPFVVVRSEVERETRSSYNYLSQLIGRTRETRAFNSQSRLSQITKTVDSLVPNLADGGTRSLLQTRDENISFSYIPNPRNTRETLNNRIETRINGLIAIDADNQYFAEDFRQDFVEADKAGNLSADMTSSYGAIKTVVETINFDNQGQSTIKTETFDHVRNSLTGTVSDARAGSNSFSQYNASRRVIVWRDGIDLSETKGARLEQFSAGELSLQQAVALVKRLLARQTEKNARVAVDVIGFDKSIRRGSTFNVKSRTGISYGNFLTVGFNIEGTNLGTTPLYKTNLSLQEI